MKGASEAASKDWPLPIWKHEKEKRPPSAVKSTLLQAAESGLRLRFFGDIASQGFVSCHRDHRFREKKTKRQPHFDVSAEFGNPAADFLQQRRPNFDVN